MEEDFLLTVPPSFEERGVGCWVKEGFLLDESLEERGDWIADDFRLLETEVLSSECRAASREMRRARFPSFSIFA